MMQDTDQRNGGLIRSLSGVDATCVVIGAIIGVGIFFTPSQVARVSGSTGMALAAWTVGGALALCGALTFAALGRMYPRTAGQYQILRDAYGPFPGFLFVFCNSTAIQAGAIAVIGAICAQNLTLALSGQPAADHWLTAIAAVLIIGLALANVAGLAWGAGVQNLTVAAKLLTLAAVTLLAVFAGGAQTPAAPAAPVAPAAEEVRGLAIVATLFAAMVPAFFSFGGWQHALWISGEVRNPQRNLPIAIVGGVSVVAVVYVLANWAYFALLGFDGVANSQALAADAVAASWQSTGRRVVAGAVAVSAFGVLNAQLLSGPRLVYGMACDGRFFKIFARSHPRFHTPVAAILMLAILGLALLVVAGKDASDKLVTGVVMIDSVFFGLTALALIVLRRRNPGSARKPLGYPWIPALFVIGEVGLLAGSFWDPATREAAAIGALWIVVGAICYLAFFSNSSRGGEPTDTL